MRIDQVTDAILSKVADKSQLPASLREPEAPKPASRTKVASGGDELKMHDQFSAWLYMRKKLISKIHCNPRKRSTIEAGHPDYTLLRNNKCLLIELKDPPNGLSDMQIARIAELEAAGNTVYVCTSFEAAMRLTLETFDLRPGQLE